MKAKSFYGFLGLLIVVMVLSACASSGSGSGSKSGSASATAQGFGGEVKVTVTVEKGKITNVEAEGPNETTGIGSRAIDMLPGVMVQKNSVEVDALSGASVTSKGLIQAAKEAFSKI